MKDHYLILQTEVSKLFCIKGFEDHILGLGCHMISPTQHNFIIKHECKGRPTYMNGCVCVPVQLKNSLVGQSASPFCRR